jgi:hypothetical protein
MAKLSTRARAKLPGKVFAGPHRSFPLTDRGHDEAAIFDVARAVRAGHLTSTEGARIKAEARRKLKD